MGASALGASGRRALRAAGFGAARYHSTAKQFRQIWISPLQSETGGTWHTSQKPFCVSVGAAGTGKWVHSGVRRCGEYAGMSRQRSVLPMCSRAVLEQGTGANRTDVAACRAPRPLCSPRGAHKPLK